MAGSADAERTPLEQLLAIGEPSGWAGG